MSTCAEDKCWSPSISELACAESDTQCDREAVRYHNSIMSWQLILVQGRTLLSPL